MGNVISILTKESVIWPSIPTPQFDPMPAWVTSDRGLMREVFRLQKSGWIIRPMPDFTLLCWNPRVVTKDNAPVDFDAAAEIQEGFDFVKRRKIY